MALVANPSATSVWRDPNVMSTSSVNSSLTSLNPNSMQSHHQTPYHQHHLQQLQQHHQQHQQQQLLPLPQHLVGGPSPISSEASTTPVPPHSVVSQSSDGCDTIKTEDGQELLCVVCGDKSSGKHYGQFTCEGKSQFLFLNGNCK